MNRPMLYDEFKNLLRTEREVIFYFTKKDGSERRTNGTLNIDVVTENAANPKGVGKSFDDEDIINYYDNDAKGWRSFHFSSLIRIGEKK